MLEIVTHVHGRVSRIVLLVFTHVSLEDTANLCTTHQLINQSGVHSRLGEITTNRCNLCDQILHKVVDRTRRQVTRRLNTLLIHAPKLVYEA